MNGKKKKQSSLRVYSSRQSHGHGLWTVAVCPPGCGQVWVGVGMEVCCPEEGSGPLWVLGRWGVALTVLWGDLFISKHLTQCTLVTAHSWFNDQLIWIRYYGRNYFSAATFKLSASE